MIQVQSNDNNKNILEFYDFIKCNPQCVLDNVSLDTFIKCGLCIPTYFFANKWAKMENLKQNYKSLNVWEKIKYNLHIADYQSAIENAIEDFPSEKNKLVKIYNRITNDFEKDKSFWLNVDLIRTYPKANAGFDSYVEIKEKNQIYKLTLSSHYNNVNSNLLQNYIDTLCYTNYSIIQHDSNQNSKVIIACTIISGYPYVVIIGIVPNYLFKNEKYQEGIEIINYYKRN